MVRKVKLDILEIDLQEMRSADLADERPAGSDSEGTPGRGWGRYGKYLVAGSALFLALSVGITFWYQAGTKPARETAPPKEVAVSDGLRHFQNFAVDFRDGGGNYRVLLCDVALELNDGMNIPGEETDVRKVIYRTLKGKSIESLTVAKGKKALKKELESELGKAVGANTVKQVYFTRFTLM